MPSATGLLRLSLAIAAVFAAGIAALIFASRLIPPDRVRQAVLTEIRSATGLEPAIRGEAAVSLFPSAMVSFSDVTLGDERPTPALSADRLTVRLALLPLLVGRIEPADLTLTRPRLLVDVEPDGRSNWSSLMATLARTLKPRARGAEPGMSLSELRMTGGTIIVTEEARGISEELSDVELSFAWPSIARSFGATGRFTWRGEVFDASANAGDLLAALSGDRSGLKLRLAGAPFKLAFEGAMSQKPSFKMEGTLAIDGKSLREALRWANRQPLPGSGMGPFALKAQTSFTGGMAIMLGVNIELDGNAAEGVLAVATEPRVTLKGTLAADTLDLSPYVVDIRSAALERPRLEPGTVRDRQSGELRSRPASVLGAGQYRECAAGAHRGCGQSARCPSHARDRRSAGLWRRAQGRVHSLKDRNRRRREDAAAVHRRRS